MTVPDRTTLVLRDLRDGDGLSRRTVTLTAEGGLEIAGHDIDHGADAVYGEYEFERRVSPADTFAVRELVGVAPDGDLLTAIETRFDSTIDLEVFLAQHGVKSEFWSRVGD
ncbi:MAG TPA: hypothetical protein VNS55_00080 [Nocardioides sp.]|nr:hypothetical protein [Nocardioides sp.]